jgi:signal transduction histidine kinase/ligand-binding sensor domain-containing protein
VSTDQTRSAPVFVTALAYVLFAWSSAYALNPALDISQYAHTAWKIRDGFSRGTIYSIAQTPDGYLWLGTDLGMLRFDGVRPVPWQPPDQPLPSSNIRSLLVTRDGTLWIGTESGIASWKDEKLTRYDQLAGRFVGRLVEDHEGAIWLTSFFNFKWTLCVIRHGQGECYGDDGGPGAGALGLYEDRRGSLWVGTVGTTNGVWRWRPGPPKFYLFPPQANGIRGLYDDADGVLLVSRPGGIIRFVDGRTEMAYPFPPSKKQFDFPLHLRDRDGGLWLGSTLGGGLAHIHRGMTDTFASSNGLSGDTVSSLFEDREGNIWVATSEGLDRFRDIAVASYSGKQGISSALAGSVLAAGDGSIWIATSDGLNRWNAGRTLGQEPRGGVHSIFQDHLERVWLSTSREVGYLDNGRLVAVKGPGGGLIRSIVEDGDGNLWIANQEVGLFRVSTLGGRVDKFAWAELNPEGRPASALAADGSQGGVWLGLPQGGVLHFVAGQVRASYGVAEGLAAGFVRNLRLAPDRSVWAATDGGLSHLKDGRITTLTARQGLPCDGVSWSIEDGDQATWLALRCGLVRISRAEMDAWTGAVQTNKTADVSVRVTVFDTDEGFRASPNANYFTSPVVRASDGRLWFIATGGVNVVDPHSLPFNDLPPPVQIEQVIADRKTYAAHTSANGRVSLPALTRDLQIDYSALSLVAPERNIFRVKLEGHDSDWQDVGTRRQAFYNDLRPGAYRFRVRAANNSGVWNEAGAVLEFSVAPAYYQTIWFAALSAATLIALVWGGHRLRLRIVEKHGNEISALNERMMKAQEQERIRIAGELHDGVMQEMLAVTMMLGTVKRRVREDPAATATLDRAQQKLVQAGTDLRQLSHDLHPPLLQEAGLPKAVTAYCEQFSAASNIPVACDAAEDVRDLSRGAALALFRIVQEALGNAAKHASAKQITVHLARSDGMVSLTVSDDGVGLDPSRFASAGGLGLVMMRERATQLNGRFDFESVPGRGTTIRVVVPFR